MADLSYLRGVVVPMVTPLEPDGRRVNASAVGRLVDHLLSGGIRAIFVAGSTGEGPALEEAEWLRLVSAASEANTGRALLLAGVLAPATAPAARMARLAAQAGADVVVATVPYYYHCSEGELLRHFHAIADASPLPVLLYSIPQNTGSAIPYPVCLQLAASPAFVGLKDSSGDVDSLRSWIPRFREVAPDFRTFLGTDHLVDVAVLVGADGIVPSLANLVPNDLVEAFETVARGEAAAETLRRVTRLMRLYEVRTPRQAGILVGLKCALEVLRIPAGPPALPVTPPSADEKQFVARVLHEHLAGMSHSRNGGGLQNV